MKTALAGIDRARGTFELAVPAGSTDHWPHAWLAAVGPGSVRRPNVFPPARG